jgi:hypothetical protein
MQDPISDQRIFSVVDANEVDYGGRCTFSHCLGEPMERILGKNACCWADKQLTTLALINIHRGH